MGRVWDILLGCFSVGQKHSFLGPYFLQINQDGLFLRREELLGLLLLPGPSVSQSLSFLRTRGRRFMTHRPSQAEIPLPSRAFR